jgi:pimeloyl-ACP methyl ester carboxylesterase
VSEAVNARARIAPSPDEETGETAASHAGTVISSDGTHTGYWRTGEGPPLVLVHGTSADHTRWDPVLPALEEHFTVYAVDRRGRGESGDAAEYPLEREVEDVVAVVDSIGAPASLLGHSYGAICSLEASRLSARVRRFVLYEPPLPTSMVTFTSRRRKPAVLQGRHRGRNEALPIPGASPCPGRGTSRRTRRPSGSRTWSSSSWYLGKVRARRSRLATWPRECPEGGSWS